MKVLKFIAHVYELTVRFAQPAVASVILLAMRIVWGYGFFLAGKGKLMNLDKTAEFFGSLHIPAAYLNAIASSSTECIGGLLLLFGIGSRWVAFALTCVMTVAYLTAHNASFSPLFTDADPTMFFNQAPFWFLFTTLTVLALGPGWFSADGILRCVMAGRERKLALESP